MSPPARHAPAGLEILQAGGGHGLGNALYLDRAAGALLKVYRPRRTGIHVWREAARSLAHRVFEGKRGTSPRERARTEAKVLGLWKQHGFDVPAVIECELPDGLHDPGLWLEYCPGPTLDRWLAERERSDDEVRDAITRLAKTQGRRHRKAIELGEPLLLQEHPSIVHVLVCGDRLVEFDFENAYGAGHPVASALTDELAGTLRSLFRRAGERAEACFAAYLDGYPERELLRESAERAVRGGGVGRTLRRWKDRRRRNRPAKTEVMERVLERVSG